MIRRRWRDTQDVFSRHEGNKLSLLEFELVFIFLEESLEFGSEGQETFPLFVVQGHREAPESVDTYSALLTHAQFKTPAAFFSFDLFFKLGQFCLQFFIARFAH